jgi:type I restriction enzyme R subunit
MSLSEGGVEQACLTYLAAMGYHTAFGPMIGPGGEAEERVTWGETLLRRRLEEAVARINPNLPESARSDAIARLTRAESQNPLSENRRFHELLTQGIPVEYRQDGGDIRTDLVWLVDFTNWENNDWLAVNQYTIIEQGKNRRPDVVLFVNGLPLVVIELKKPVVCQSDWTAALPRALDHLGPPLAGSLE